MSGFTLRKAAMGLGSLLAVVCISTVSSLAASPNWNARLDETAPNPQPPYPDAAQQNGEQGTIVLRVHVRSSGRADKVRILETSGFADLDMAAEQGVLNWHYVPAAVDADDADWAVVKVVYQLPTYVPASTISQPTSH
ncbi:MAG: energy transducer TonB [Rhizomicrobium sp.]|jgi:protein TonB